MLRQKPREQNFWATKCSYHSIIRFHFSSTTLVLVKTKFWTMNIVRNQSCWYNFFQLDKLMISSKNALRWMKGKLVWTSYSYPKWRTPWARMVYLCPFRLRFLCRDFLEWIWPTEAVLEALQLLPLAPIIFFIPERLMCQDMKFSTHKVTE